VPCNYCVIHFGVALSRRKREFKFRRRREINKLLEKYLLSSLTRRSEIVGFVTVTIDYESVQDRGVVQPSHLSPVENPCSARHLPNR
jgi:hypothetical protein